MSFAAGNRGRHLEALESQFFDIAVVGGGITGAGIARDAASRGMKVALIEASDFASGTSSRSSKLIHGGLRYLESLEFGLVFEALSERRKLFEMAPNMVHPLRFILPLYEGDRVGMFKMGLGMMLYDLLALFEAPKSHRSLAPDETIHQLPELRSDKLKGAFAYYDAYMDDDRLVHETLRSAHSWGAVSVNYVSAEGAEFEADQVSSLICTDRLSDRTLSIKAKHFVSTVGPWTDELGQSVLKDWQPIMRPSKGIHLTFHRDRLQLKDAVVMAADVQKRIVFGIPRHEMVIIGTTDTDFSGHPQDVRSTQEDVEYLLRIANHYFPGAELTEQDIVASYSGVRPLVADGSLSESATSRSHVIRNDSRNVTFVAGGKYTTYRKMAEEAVESFLSRFSVEEQVAWSRSASEEPLNPKVTRDSMRASRERVESSSWPFSKKIMNWLIDRHGAEAFDFVEALELEDAAFDDWTKVWRLEARHAIKHTMCLNLRDFYLRRVPLFLTEYDHGYRFLEPVAQVFKKELSLDDSQIEQQLEALGQHEKSEMGWRKERPSLPSFS